VSNHRDIVLDTLLNAVCLNMVVMTASAIGDNLVQKDFLNVLAKLNRNFLTCLSPREMLQSSKNLSEYIGHLIHENRSVWITARRKNKRW
jgi:hypothetical protein